MNFLPTDIEKIINDYKNDLEMFDKIKKKYNILLLELKDVILESKKIVFYYIKHHVDDDNFDFYYEKYRDYFLNKFILLTLTDK